MEKIIDWFIILRIRILNFIKEHKYIATGIGVFLFSFLVYFVAFASDDPYEGKVNTTISVSQKSVSSVEEIDDIKSFSTLIYDISYMLSVDEIPEGGLVRNSVEVVAELNSEVDANWIVPSDESTDYNLSDDKKTLTVKLYSIRVGEQLSKQIYLKVNNVRNDKQIVSNIKVRESTSEFSDTITKSVRVTSEKVPLTVNMIPGNAYKTEELESGRLVPFGIVVGLDKSYLQNDSLEGLYFDESLNLPISALQDDGRKLNISEDYGVYDESLNLFYNMPKNIYDSGNISIEKSSSIDSDTDKNVKTASLSLIGSSKINLKIGEEYTEYGIEDSEGSVFCKISTSNCSRVIVDEKGDIVTKIDTSKSNSYLISYKYMTESSSVTLKREVIINGQKTSITLSDGKSYTLNGNENITLEKGEAYVEKGIDLDYTLTIRKDGNKVNSVDTDEVGTYILTYAVEEIVDGAAKLYNIERHVEVIENRKRISASIMETKSLSYPIGKEVDEIPILLDGEKIVCNLTNDCVVTYYSDEELSNEVELDPNKESTYYVKYYFVDKNGFELIAINTIKFATSYIMKISDIKSDGSINAYDNKIILGTYYVNVISPRDKDDTSDINVNLTLGNVTRTGVNKYYSKGTMESQISFYDTNLTRLKPTDFIAYGENIILGSTYKYMKDGDDNISNVTNVISLSNNYFELLNYNDDIKTDLEYFLEVNGKRVVSIDESGNLKYIKEIKEDGSLDYETISEVIGFSFIAEKNEDKVSSLKYTIQSMKPGTQIDFKVLLKTGIESNAVLATSGISFNQNNQNYSMNNVSSSVNVTAFKARTKLLINDCDYDVIIDGASKEEQISTWQIYPEVKIPSELITTNILGIETTDINIVVTLPKEINYIYNESYLIPTVKTLDDGSTELRYSLRNKKINEWIEPIYFETNYDLDTESGKNLSVKTVITASSNNGISDTSREELRTTIRNITYQNNQEIAYSLSTYQNSISSNTLFEVNTRLFKNSNKDFDNISLITILPESNGSDENKFNGTYVVSNIPKTAFCTNEMVSETTYTNVKWSLCSSFENLNYKNVTAIKEDNIKLTDSNKYYESNIIITPSGNATDDVYTIKSYLIKPDKIVQIPSLKINVISKKIEGTVWEDFDTNGLMDYSEIKISDVSLELYKQEGNEWKLQTTVISDAKGKYSFGNLEPANYYVVAKYNNEKFGLTTSNVSDNKSISSSFISEETDKETIIKTDVITVTKNTKLINNINLGLTLKKEYKIKLNKYINKVIVTSNLGTSKVYNHGQSTLAKVDVKDLSKVKVKVLYTIELENVGYYPGYINKVRDYVPTGMNFNPDYEENKGWSLNPEGYLENTTLQEELIYEGEKKYLNLILDITSKEAGEFVNYASVEDEDLQILSIQN